MYKLMLVDDEYGARKSVIDKIDWSQCGFEIVCEAENGNEAYELFELHKPDVVITDIKMPFMDGLELSSKILEDYPLTKIIILTGFDEFEYAKKGLNLHVMDYILKPISAIELVETLKEIKEKLDKEIEEKRNIERLKKHYEKSYSQMRDKFLESLVRGEYPEEEIEEWLEYYQVDLKDKDKYVVAIVKIDDFYKKRKNSMSLQTELRKVALLDMIEEVNASHPLGTFFLLDNQVIVIASCHHPDLSEDEFVQKMFRRFEMLKQTIEKYLEFTVTVGIGAVVKSLDLLDQSMKTALNARDYKIILGNSQIIYIKDLEYYETEEIMLNDLQIRQLKRIIKLGNEEGLNEYFNTLFNRIKRANLSIPKSQMYLVELVTVVMRASQEMNVEVHKIQGFEVNVFDQIMGFNQLTDMKQWLADFCQQVMKSIQNSREDQTKDIVQKAKNYAKENYNEMDLNIEAVSNYLHYSPNYFSTIFKKETGIPFMTYLLNLRLEAAKDLLLSTNMKTFEVAMEVGFSSSNYFSFCFKKELGISPSKYRKENKQ